MGIAPRPDFVPIRKIECFEHTPRKLARSRYGNCQNLFLFCRMGLPFAPSQRLATGGEHLQDAQLQSIGRGE
jgi:hypothetical protein